MIGAAEAEAALESRGGHSFDRFGKSKDCNVAPLALCYFSLATSDSHSTVVLLYLFCIVHIHFLSLLVVAFPLERLCRAEEDTAPSLSFHRRESGKQQLGSIPLEITSYRVPYKACAYRLFRHNYSWNWPKRHYDTIAAIGGDNDGRNNRAVTLSL